MPLNLTPMWAKVQKWRFHHEITHMSIGNKVLLIAQAKLGGAGSMDTKICKATFNQTINGLQTPKTVFLLRK
jgi:hypothetical protein